MEAKRLLRSRLIAARAARPANDIAAAGVALAEQASRAWSNAGTVATYSDRTVSKGKSYQYRVDASNSSSTSG